MSKADDKELEETKMRLYEFIHNINLADKTIEDIKRDIHTILNYIENSISKEEYDKIKEENEILKLKERSSIIGNINEIKIEDLEPILKPYYISKEVIKEAIKEISRYEECARDNIEERIVIADSDSLNFGRKQAHGRNIEVLRKLLEGK